MQINKAFLIFLFIILISISQSAFAQIAIIANKDNPQNDISIFELKQIYLGKETVFSNGENIIITEYKDLKNSFYEILLNWSLLKYKKHWMKKIFAGESSVIPKEFKNPEELNDFVSKNIGAIAFISSKDVDSKVKTLTVEMLNPGSEGYPFNQN